VYCLHQSRPSRSFAGISPPVGEFRWLTAMKSAPGNFFADEDDLPCAVTAPVATSSTRPTLHSTLHQDNMANRSCNTTLDSPLLKARDTTDSMACRAHHHPSFHSSRCKPRLQPGTHSSAPQHRPSYHRHLRLRRPSQTKQHSISHQSPLHRSCQELEQS
jgi:hypothetical protein